MSDFLNIILGSKIDQSSQAVKSLEEQIKLMSGKIKEAISVKLQIDASQLEILTKQIEQTQEKIRTKTTVKGSQFINQEVEHQAFNEISARIRDIRKNVDELAKVDITTNKKGQMTFATLTYYNKELGKTVVETMGWSEAQKQVNGQMVKFKTFETLGFKYSDNMAKARQETIKAKQALTDLNLYKQKMLGGNGFLGDIDIFASKQKGRFDERALSKIRADVEALTIDTPDLNNRMKQLSIEFSSLGKNAQEAGGVLIRAIENAGKFLRFYLVGGLLVGFVNAIKQSVGSVVQMDTALTSLNKVVNLSTSELKEMRDASVELGKELGKSSIEIMQGMAEFGRITKVKSEIVELTRVATMAANVTDMTAAESAKALTTAMITFGKDASEAMGILDSWNEIQNNFRTSATDLATAIGKVGSASKIAKTDMADLEGIVTAIVSSTGIDGSEAGTAVKSFMSRIYRTDESDVEEIGKTAKALKDLIDVDTKNAQGELKGFNEIVTEIANKWGTLSKQEQLAVAQSIGSTYHYSKFIALMESFNIKVDATEKALNSQNSAFEENQKYLESIQGRWETLGTTIEGLTNKLIDSDFLKAVVQGLTDFVVTIDKTIETVGGFNTIVYLAITALSILKGKAITQAIIGMVEMQVALGATSTATAVSTGAFKALSGVLATLAKNPIALVTIGLGLLAVAMIKYKDEVMIAREKTEKLTEEYKKFNDALDSGKINNVTNALNNLVKNIDYEGAKRKISELTNEIIRLENAVNNQGTNGRGRSAVGNERSSLNKKLNTNKEIREELQKQVDLVDEANKKAQIAQRDADRYSLMNQKGQKWIDDNKSDDDDTGTPETSDYEKAYASYYQIIRDLNFELDKQNEILTQKEDLDKIPILLERNKLLDKQKQNLHAINEARRKELATLKPTSERYQELIEKIQDTSLEWWKLDTAQKSNLKTIEQINEAQKKLVEEQEKEIENQIKESVELEKKLKFQEAENKYKQELLDLEKDIYGTTQDAWEEASNARIDELQNELDLLDEKADKEKESEERAKRLLEITELELKLQNLQSQKAVQQLKKDSNGNWQFEYVVNQEQIESVQKDIKEKQTDYNNWEEQNRLEHKRKKIQDQIEEEREIQKIKKDSYDKQKKELETAYQNEKDIIEVTYWDIDAIVAKRMDAIKATHNGKLDEMLSDAQSRLSTLKKLYQSALDIQSKIEDIDTSSSSSLSRSFTSTPLSTKNRSTSPQIFDTGGYTSNSEGLAWLDKKEIVLNKIDTENLLKAVDITRNMVQNLRLPQLNFSGVGGKTEQHFHIGKLVFPNVVDGQDIVDTLNDLPRIIIQHI